MTVKNDASCSRRPDTATRNMVRAIPLSVWRTSGSSMRLPAKLTLASVMTLPPGLPGRAVCPALGPGGRWTPWHAERAPGASDEANEVGHGSSCRVGSARVPGWLVECLRLGSGMPGTVRPEHFHLGDARIEVNWVG